MQYLRLNYLLLPVAIAGKILIDFRILALIGTSTQTIQTVTIAAEVLILLGSGLVAFSLLGLTPSLGRIIRYAAILLMVRAVVGSLPVILLSLQTDPSSIVFKGLLLLSIGTAIVLGLAVIGTSADEANVILLRRLLLILVAGLIISDLNLIYSIYSSSEITVIEFIRSIFRDELGFAVPVLLLGISYLLVDFSPGGNRRQADDILHQTYNPSQSVKREED